MNTLEIKPKLDGGSWVVQITICLALLFSAGCLDGLGDSISFHWGKNVGASTMAKHEQFWNPALSWKNKYAGGDPALGEKFPLSSTALVFATDGWHLLKTLKSLCLMLALVVGLPSVRKARIPSSVFGRAEEIRSRNTSRTTALLFGGAFLLAHFVMQAGFTLVYR